MIEVDVIGSSEFDWRGTINPEGFLDGIDFLENPVYALCKEENYIANEVAKNLSRILRNPQVTVKILDKSGRPISYLYGAVKTPQKFKLNREIRLNELIILSGGITETASGDIQILRSTYLDCAKVNNSKLPENQNVSLKNNQSTQIINLKVSEIIKGQTQSNPIIQSGDVVTLFEAEPIYVIGGVQNPRQINSVAKMTLVRAIATAGGFSKDSDRKSIVIYRKMNDGRTLIEIDFEKIEQNELPDFELEKYDIVEVGQRGKEKRKTTPVVKILESKKNNIMQMPLRIIE